MAGAGSERRRIFAREVFAGAGRAAAAIAAGYKGSDRTLAVTANRLMRHPVVVEELARLEAGARVQAIATREEALELLTRQLRFSPKAFLTEAGTLDLGAAVASGAAELLDGVEVSETEDGARVRVRFPDRQAAVDRLAKLLGWNKPEQHEIKHTTELKAMVAQLTDEELGISLGGAGETTAEPRGPEAGDLVKTGSIPAGVVGKQRRKRRPTAAKLAPPEPQTPAL
jgi:hypothetical protein